MIVSADSLNEHGSVVTVAPITTGNLHRVYPHEVHVPEGGGLREGKILCGQLRTVSKQRLESYIAGLPVTVAADLDVALLRALQLA